MHIGAYTGIQGTTIKSMDQFKDINPQISTVLWLHSWYIHEKRYVYVNYCLMFLLTYNFTIHLILFIFENSKTNEECLFILAY